MATRERLPGYEKLTDMRHEINLAKGEVTHALFPPVADAMTSAMGRPEANTSVVGPGMFELREAISAWSNAHYSTEFDPDQVVLTGGSGEALLPVLKQFNPLTTTVHVAAINYGDHIAQATELGFRVRAYGLDENFLPDPEEITNSMSTKRNSSLLVLTNPSNPTGKVYPPELLETIADSINKIPGAHVVTDEVFDRTILDDGLVHTPFARLAPEKTYTINGLSKCGLPGLRLGYVITPPGKQEDVLRARGKVSTATYFSMAGAIPVFNGDCEADIAEINNGLRERRKDLHDHLTSLGLDTPWPNAGYFLFPSVAKFGGGDEVTRRLKDEFNIIVIPGSGYGPAGEDRIRISYAPSPDVMNEGMRRFGLALSNW